VGSPDAVTALLDDPASALVAVDFDGTLAAIVDRPADARPVDGAREALADLAPRIGCVAIISGRAATEIVELAALTAQSRVRVLGHYGLQTWRAGALESPPPDDAVERARTRLGSLLGGVDPGVRVEDKTHSLAVHTRGAARPAEALEAIRAGLLGLAEECGLEAVPGRYVIELRPRGTDKGEALRGLADELRPRTVIYIGDDLGDLPAYDAVDALRRERGVVGLTVASVDPADPDVPPTVAERAELVLAGPTAVVAWLAGLAAMLA
jgi:trehalose 6-phosphate phosphatase